MLLVKCVYRLWKQFPLETIKYESESESECFLGCKQEEYNSGGVMGEDETEAVLHTHHDKKCLSFLHMGFPKDQPTFRCKYYKEILKKWTENSEFTLFVVL